MPIERIYPSEFGNYFVIKHTYSGTVTVPPISESVREATAQLNQFHMKYPGAKQALIAEMLPETTVNALTYVLSVREFGQLLGHKALSLIVVLELAKDARDGEDKSGMMRIIKTAGHVVLKKVRQVNTPEQAFILLDQFGTTPSDQLESFTQQTPSDSSDHQESR